MNNELGRQGERMAEDHLRSKGYTILKRNYRSGHCEADLIATKDQELIIIEVKTRSTSVHGQPELAIDSKKKENLRHVAEAYQEVHDCSMDIRFDILSIILTRTQVRIKHFEDAFWPGVF